MRLLSKKQQGSALVTVIIILPFLILICAQYMSLSLNSLFVAKRDQSRTHAQLAADAGIDYSMQRINQDGTWSGTDPEVNPGAEIELMNNGDVRTTYETVVSDIDETQKLVTSTGKTFRPAASTAAESTITINANLRAVESGNYSIVTGVGGLIMENSAKVLGGDVFINGELHLKNTSQIGLALSPTNVYVANQLCPIPADATYPRLCNSGENNDPITIENSARINGNVRANYQYNPTGMSGPGLTASSGVASQPLPPHDRDAQKAAVTITRTGSDASCSGSQSKVWAANTKIVGDVELKNTCSIIIEGDIWITGNFKINNSATATVADALGSESPDIMIDGAQGAILEQSGLLKVNSVDTGFQLITYWSEASCSPDCANVTGQELYNSRDDVTIQLNNSASAPNTIFYARWSRVEIQNTGSIGALVGQTVYLKNSGTITFGTSVGTGTVYWVIDGYRRVIN